ncbi:MAG TPA: hypothetical protein VEI97_02565 [bacterium]|nr:hypothetical protein [bacterium]
MPFPDSLDFSLTAFQGDYYLRLPVLDFPGVVETLNDPLVMVDGAEPTLYPDLEVLEPEDEGEGLFPIVVRTVVCIARKRLIDWLPRAVLSCAFAGLMRQADDADIAGVLYWGSEEERWRLRRVCIGRYSRYEDLPDTSELDSYGAFRDWLLVQGNQYQAWTLYRHGWSDFNSTDPGRLLEFLRRYLQVHEHFLSLAYPGLAIASVSVPKDLDREITAKTARPGIGVRWTYRWQLGGGLERVGEEGVRA